MSEDTATVAVVPEPAATDGLTDAALEAIFGKEAASDEPATDGPDTDDEDTETPAEDAPAAEAAPAVEPDAIDLSKLDDITADPVKVEPAVEQASALTRKIQEYIPNEQVLGMVVDSHQRMTAIEQSLQKGDVQGLHRALGNTGFSGLLDAIYANEHLRNAFVDRVIEDSSGVKPDPRVNSLESKINELTNFINGNIQQQQTTQQQQARSQQFANLNTTVSSLFEQVRFPKDDRHAFQQATMTKALMSELAAAGKLEAALRGDVRIVRETLKPLLNQFVASDKKTTIAAADKRAQLEQKPKVVAPTAGSTAAGGSGDSEPDIFQQAANMVQKLRKKGK